jgi:hypothetical protein
MTGGGVFTFGTCTKATFGGNASGQPGVSAKGHFNYINHCTGVHINGPVTAILAVNPATQTMTFQVTTNTCTATVTWRDVAEPGSNQDTISITGCSQSTGNVTINHGNIQWHNQVRPS